MALISEPFLVYVHLIILSFAPNKVVVNMGILQDDKVKISKKKLFIENNLSNNFIIKI